MLTCEEPSRLLRTTYREVCPGVIAKIRPIMIPLCVTIAALELPIVLYQNLFCTVRSYLKTFLQLFMPPPNLRTFCNINPRRDIYGGSHPTEILNHIWAFRQALAGQGFPADFCSSAEIQARFKLGTPQMKKGGGFASPPGSHLIYCKQLGLCGELCLTRAMPRIWGCIDPG